MGLHPKLRRQIKAGTAGKRDEKSLIAKAAQKKVEKQRVAKALANMQDDWNEYLSESLLFKSRKELAAELIPEVKGKKRTKVTQVKSKFAAVLSGKLFSGFGHFSVLWKGGCLGGVLAVWLLYHIFE